VLVFFETKEITKRVVRTDDRGSSQCEIVRERKQLKIACRLPLYKQRKFLRFSFYFHWRISSLRKLLYWWGEEEEDGSRMTDGRSFQGYRVDKNGERVGWDVIQRGRGPPRGMETQDSLREWNFYLDQKVLYYVQKTLSACSYEEHVLTV
jgi:hypothetical protein